MIAKEQFGGSGVRSRYAWKPSQAVAEDPPTMSKDLDFLGQRPHPRPLPSLFDEEGWIFCPKPLPGNNLRHWIARLACSIYRERVEMLSSPQFDLVVIEARAQHERRIGRRVGNLPSPLVIVFALSVSMHAYDSVPIIDVEPLVRMKWDEAMAEDPEVKDVVRQLDLACRHMGFFYVSGHGVAPELCQAVLDAGREFFTQSESQKLRIGMSSASGFRGYQKLGENITKGIPDQHEAIDYFKEFEPSKALSRSENPLLGLNQWPDHVSKFRPLVQEYLDVMTELGRTIMKGIALALGGPRDLFEGERAGDPFWIFRIIGYPPVTNLSHFSDADKDIGCGEHTDYGLLTLVNQDQNITALQVKTKDKKWIWVDPTPGTFVVNIGDMLTIWTNGVYQSTLHRVINNNSKYRVSVPFFYEPNFDALVEPLSFLQSSAAPGGTKYAPVVYGDHVINKVLNNFG